MNTLKRILIIVVAAVLVAGATFTVAQWSGLSSTANEAQSGLQSAPADMPAFDSGSMPTRPAGGSDRNAGGLMGLADVVKNVGIFGLLFVVVMLINQARNRLTKRWPQRRTSNAATR